MLMAQRDKAVSMINWFARRTEKDKKWHPSRRETSMPPSGKSRCKWCSHSSRILAAAIRSIGEYQARLYICDFRDRAFRKVFRCERPQRGRNMNVSNSKIATKVISWEIWDEEYYTARDIYIQISRKIQSFVFGIHVCTSVYTCKSERRAAFF